MKVRNWRGISLGTVVDTEHSGGQRRLDTRRRRWLRTYGTIVAVTLVDQVVGAVWRFLGNLLRSLMN
jgi:hypothetical protein